jgi:hypothetical protein
MGSSPSLDLVDECLRLCSSPLSKARLAQTTDNLGEGGLSMFPSVFCPSLALELVGKYRDQRLLKLRNMRGQKSKQCNMKVLSLCLKPIDRELWKKEDRINFLVEGIMSSERKGLLPERWGRRQWQIQVSP